MAQEKLEPRLGPIERFRRNRRFARVRHRLSGRPSSLLTRAHARAIR
jgi:hypothetical protein